MNNFVKILFTSWRNDLTFLFSRDFITFLMLTLNQYKSLLMQHMWVYSTIVGNICFILLYKYTNLGWPVLLLATMYLLSIVVIMRPSVTIKNFHLICMSKLTGTMLVASALITALCSYGLYKGIPLTLKNCALATIIADFTLLFFLWICDSRPSIANIGNSALRAGKMFIFHLFSLASIVLVQTITLKMGTNLANTLTTAPLEYRTQLALAILILFVLQIIGSMYLTPISTAYTQFLYQESDRYYGTSY